MLGTAMKSKSRLVMEVESDHPESSAAVLDSRKISGVSLILAPEDHKVTHQPSHTPRTSDFTSLLLFVNFLMIVIIE
jgi:hypothetical protein